MNFIPKKIIIFDTIKPSNFLLVKKYLQSENEIFFFSIDEKIKNDYNIKLYLKNNKLINLNDTKNGWLIGHASAFFAHKDLEKFYLEYFSKSSLIKLGCQLFQSEAITLMYKKRLLTELKLVYEKELIIKKIARNTDKEIIFYPDSFFQIYKDKKFLNNNRVSIQKISNLSAIASKYRVKINNIILLSYPFYILFRKIRFFGRKSKEKTSVHLGININLPSLFGYNYNIISYIVDPRYKLQKQDIVFIDERYGCGYNKEYEKKGYLYFEFFNKREIMSCEFIFSTILKKFFPIWIKTVLLSFFERNCTIEITRLVLSDYIKWNFFFDCHSLKNHFTILTPDNISKIIIMNQNQCETWYLWPDCYAGYHSFLEDTEKTAIFNSMIKYDHGIFYGEKIARWFKNLCNDISKYHTIGILSSQRTHEIRHGTYTSNLPTLLKKREITGKIIGIFDTSYEEKWQIIDGIKFCEDILRLLDEIQEIFIIFKEKTFKEDYFENPQYIGLLEKIQSHPRCIFIEKTRKNCVYTSDVIAYSDLVISAAFTSPTIEALGAKTRAFYYDAGNRETGERNYLNNIPHFVAHDYDELKKFVYYWLFENSNLDFELFLRDYVQGELDSYVDCHAIERLQELLKKTK